MAGEKPE
jgi:hypothetical protein